MRVKILVMVLAILIIQPCFFSESKEIKNQDGLVCISHPFKGGESKLTEQEILEIEKQNKSSGLFYEVEDVESGVTENPHSN